MSSSHLVCRAAGIALLLWLQGAHPADASIAMVDESNSSFIVEGVLSNGVDTLPVTPQVPGSLETFLSGSLQVHLTAGQITFAGGSQIVIENIGGTYLPLDLDANIAGQVANIFPGITAVGALRNVTLDITGGPIFLEPDGTFDASGLFINPLSGTFDYAVPGFLGPISDSLFGGPSLGNLTGSVTQLPTGKFQIVVPFYLFYVANIDQLTLELNQTGRILAITPEPSSYVLATMAAISLAGMLYRRKGR